MEIQTLFVFADEKQFEKVPVFQSEFHIVCLTRKSLKETVNCGTSIRIPVLGGLEVKWNFGIFKETSKTVSGETAGNSAGNCEFPSAV